MSKYFDNYLKVAPFSHALWRATETEAVSKIQINKPILDIGCGFGEFSGIFFDSTVDIGIDKSERDFDMAKRKGIYEKLILADATKIPIENGSISTCISISTLEHIKNPDNVIRETYRVLRNGGNIVITVPTIEMNENLIGYKIFNKIGLKFLSKIYVKMYHKVFKHVTIVSLDQWKSWLKETGYKNISTIPTLSKEHLAAFEIFLISGSVSQIMRSIFGERMILNTKLRTKLMTFIYNRILMRNENKLDNSNVVLVASK